MKNILRWIEQTLILNILILFTNQIIKENFGKLFSTYGLEFSCTCQQSLLCIRLLVMKSGIQTSYMAHKDYSAILPVSLPLKKKRKKKVLL